MENKKKKYYYHNNRNYYYKKNKKENKEKKKTYNDIVNVREDVSEIVTNTSFNSNLLKIVFLVIIVLAIIFGILLLFHLI